jgi:ATP-dependent DNA ligase
MSINQILTELAATPSRLEKEAILKRESNNELLKKVIVATLCPFTNYHIRKIPKHKKTDIQPTMTLEQGLSKLDKLSSRAITGNAAIEFLALLLTELQPDDAKVIERIIEKDLRCGVSEKTVNKIWTGLVKQYPVMLCHQFDEKTENYIKFPAITQLKLDGMRFNAICRSNGTCELRTRNGKEINILGRLELQLLAMAAGADCVFDGELLVYDEDMYQYLPRQTSNGILSKSLKGTITEKECDRVAATVWDVISLNDFEKGKSTVQYKDRFRALESMVNTLNSSLIKIVWSKQVDSVDEAKTIFEQFLQEGQEGIILKNLCSPWENKRVKHQVKFKGELECDLRIVDWEEGTGKNKGRLGALVLEDALGVLKVSVGSGFTDADRDTITRDVIGKVCAVKYNARIKDAKTGVESLFLPVFIEIRHDKNQPDSIKQIK